MRIKTSVATDFIRLQTDLVKILNAYGMKQAYVYEKIGMSKSTWIRKIKNQTFTGDEVLKICDVINK